MTFLAKKCDGVLLEGIVDSGKSSDFEAKLQALVESWHLYPVPIEARLIEYFRKGL